MSEKPPMPPDRPFQADTVDDRRVRDGEATGTGLPARGAARSAEPAPAPGLCVGGGDGQRDEGERGGEGAKMHARR